MYYYIWYQQLCSSHHQLTNAGAAIEAQLEASLALAAMASRQVHTLSMGAARTQAFSALVYVWSEKEEKKGFFSPLKTRARESV